MYVIQYLTALNVMIKNDFSGSKELKDQLISSPILRLWQSGSRMMHNSSCREDDDMGASIMNCCIMCVN